MAENNLSGHADNNIGQGLPPPGIPLVLLTPSSQTHSSQTSISDESIRPKGNETTARAPSPDTENLLPGNSRPSRQRRRGSAYGQRFLRVTGLSHFASRRESKFHDSGVPRERQKPRSCADYTRALLKASRLTLLHKLLGKPFGWEDKEEEKVIIDRNTGLAVLRSLIHIMPVGIALSLLILNAVGYYIGGELAGPHGKDPEKLAGLQFAAKLHELLMLASLGSLLITYIRKELAFGKGIPFGVMFSALEFRDISFLWSPEMWGSIYHEWERRRAKWFILSLIIVCTMLGVSVGPSTANLMKPRLADWPAGGTTFWINTTEDALFAREIDDSPALSHCTVDTGDLACPAGGWQVLNENYYSFWPRLVSMGSLPQSISISSPYSLRSFSLLTRQVYDGHEPIWANAFTLATSPLSAIADGLAEVGRLWSFAAANGGGHFVWRNDAIFTVDTKQPLVLAYCGLNAADPNTSLTINFPILGNLSLGKGPNSAAVSVATLSWYEFDKVPATLKTVTSGLRPGSPPSIVWVDDPGIINAINGTLGAIFILPGTNGSNGTIFPCSIDSRLTPVTLQSTRNIIKYVSGEVATFNANGTFNPEWPQIMLKAGWARYLTPRIPGTNHTILSPIAFTAGIWNSTMPSQNDYTEFIVENIITTLVANGLSRISYNVSLLSNLKGPNNPNNQWKGGAWVWEILPKRLRMGPGGNAFDISPADQNRSTQLTMVAAVNGYAYSPSGAAQIAQMVVFGVYILLVICHLFYINLTALSSASWGSAAEMTALAMNSRYAKELQNTGAGISTVDIFKEKVKLQERDKRLQIVFRSNSQHGEIHPVEENKAYS